MAKPGKTGVLREIPTNKIDRNPENPRIYFRQQELDDLTESIRRYGVQVPISVYKEAERYVLIDGERRWRCSLKLNRRTIPAIVQEKPDPFTNLVLMFNIHALREQWDLLTIALKLPRVIDLYAKTHGHSPIERELAQETGLARGTIRRCRLLMDLPDHHINIIKAELKKPKAAQRISEDFYIEMERALGAVSNYMPDTLPDEASREQARQTLLDKYRKGIIKNIVDFRKLAKIARATRVEADTITAEEAIQRIFTPNDYSINDGYERSVSLAYHERDIVTHVQTLMLDLESYDVGKIDDEVEGILRELLRIVSQLLEGTE